MNHRILVPVVAALFLAACGGGGAEEAPDAVSPIVFHENVVPPAPVAAPAPSPAPTPAPAPVASPAPSPAPTPAPAPESPARPPQSVPAAPTEKVTELICGHQGLFEPVRFTIQPGNPWAALRAEAAGVAYRLDNRAQVPYPDSSYLGGIVTDPDGSLVASGQYEVGSDGVLLGWQEYWSPTGGGVQYRPRTGYSFVGGELVQVTIYLSDPRAGTVICKSNWL